MFLPENNQKLQLGKLLMNKEELIVALLNGTKEKEGGQSHGRRFSNSTEKT